MNTDVGFEFVSICVHLWIKSFAVALFSKAKSFSVNYVPLWWACSSIRNRHYNRPVPSTDIKKLKMLAALRLLSAALLFVSGFPALCIFAFCGLASFVGVVGHKSQWDLDITKDFMLATVMAAAIWVPTYVAAGLMLLNMGATEMKLGVQLGFLGVNLLSFVMYLVVLNQSKPGMEQICVATLLAMQTAGWILGMLAPLRR